MVVTGQRRDLGEQNRAGPLGEGGQGRLDGRLDGGQAALDQDGQARGVPAARRGRVGRLDRVPGQADLGRLGVRVPAVRCGCEVGVDWTITRS